MVASDLGGDSKLVDWHDLQPLEIISSHYPARISAAVGRGFHNVFRDKLGELPMNVPKMRIVLSKNAIPFCVSTARQVSLHFQKAANNTVDDLVQSKVIIQEDDPQDWCALGFFVPKQDVVIVRMVIVRMVTDYSKINKYVRRPVVNSSWNTFLCKNGCHSWLFPAGLG